MALDITATREIDTGGGLTVSPNDVLATVEYSVAGLPDQYLSDAYATGTVYIELVSSSPWVRWARARHDMRCGAGVVLADDRIATITSDTNIGTDVLLRMLEANMVDEVTA